QPVICAGTTGYITNIYLSTGDTDSTEPDPTETSGIGTVTGTGVISGTNGDGANCRSARSIRSSIWALLPEGTTVQLRGDSNGTWVPIYCNGNRGYVSAQFVGGDGTDPDTGGSDRFSVGQNVEVANTGGQGVRLRSKASSSASIIVVLPEGQGAMVRAGSSGEWVAVTYRTTNGFIHQDYLAAVTETNPTPTPTPEPGDGLRTNDHASVTDLVNFRETPSLTGTVISSVEEDTVVLITGAKQNGYYPVTVGGFAGYIHGDYLTYTTKDLTGGSEGVGGLTPGNGRTTPQARKMISYAKKYLGYPYVWATHGPNSFDCSGFTYWVTIKTLKMDIGAGTWSQSMAGTPVAFGDLRPGDLVFFQNTFTWGLSHVGIYVGDGMFIHAQNEETGVVISSLTSTYYATRWYGARRITTD
ncbi:MAG TPA: C40 family peptidase, partial [Thermomicrobiales bacterium]|nr:C40 family peptidase [Thermomicrobiales bacterium]